LNSLLVPSDCLKASLMTSFHVTSAFLNNLKALFPDASTRTLLNAKSRDARSALRNPWFIVAAVAFSASNRSKGVPRVFEQALQDLKVGGSDKSEELMLAKKNARSSVQIGAHQWISQGYQ